MANLQEWQPNRTGKRRLLAFNSLSWVCHKCEGASSLFIFSAGSSGPTCSVLSLERIPHLQGSPLHASGGTRGRNSLFLTGDAFRTCSVLNSGHEPRVEAGGQRPRASCTTASPVGGGSCIAEPMRTWHVWSPSERKRIVDAQGLLLWWFPGLIQPCPVQSERTVLEGSWLEPVARVWLWCVLT